MTIVDIQLSPTRCEWAELREASLAVEEMGFGALWVFDHLAGVALGGDTMLECFTLLGALAEATSSIELGTLVANVWNRQAGTLVSAAASVALISGSAAPPRHRRRHVASQRVGGRAACRRCRPPLTRSRTGTLVSAMCST